MLFGASLLAGCAHAPYGLADARPLGAVAADSVHGAAAGRHYNHHGAAYRALLGAHYRTTWAAPVAAPVLDLARATPTGQPLRPRKAGGGFQTVSLSLRTPDGHEYVLRALDKDPRKTLPRWLRGTFVLNAVRDATSAANPYAALVVPPLAQAVGVAHARPRLVYVRPDEASLGESAAPLRGRLALLEEKFSPDQLAGTGAVRSTNDMLAAVYASPQHTIDAAALLRARLLDVWLGDWDRHERQWQWAARRAPGGATGYVPVPKDRDQVFYRFDDGAVPWLVRRLVPKFQTFGPRYASVRGLVRQGRFLDQRGLARCTAADFAAAAAELQARLPDSLVSRALHGLPPAAYALEGPRTLAALQARRAALPAAARQFYRSLARRPQVGGTAQAERFEVRRYPDSVAVVVFAGAAPGGSPWYHRTFLPAETREIALFGLGGGDVFDVQTAPGAPARIRVVMVGGAGQAALHTRGSARRLFFYDGPARPVPGAAHRAPARLLPYDRPGR